MSDHARAAAAGIRMLEPVLADIAGSHAPWIDEEVFEAAGRASAALRALHDCLARKGRLRETAARRAASRGPTRSDLAEGSR